VSTCVSVTYLTDLPVPPGYTQSTYDQCVIELDELERI